MTARGKKPKRGRPSLGEAARTRVVAVKLSEGEYAAVEAVAERAEVTVSSWVRDVALAAAK